MSFPEYRQKPQDHRSCILLVRPIGSFVSKDSFTKIWDHLNQLEFVLVTKYDRNLSVRFLSDYPIENSEWGDFQYHRKVLGLICIAQHNENVSGSDLETQYSDLTNLYDSTLLDSRLVILGLPRNSARSDGETSEQYGNGSPRDGPLVIEPNHYEETSSDCTHVVPDVLEKCKNDMQQISLDVSDTTRKRILSYTNTEEACSYLNLDVEYMCQSMFYVLERIRLTAMNIHLKQPAIITAPFEKPGVINMDLETK